MLHRCVTALVMVAAWGCTQGGDSPATSDPDPGTELPSGSDDNDALMEAAAAVYDPARVLQIQISIDEDDAIALSLESRELFDLIEGADCLADPWVSPFTWYSADITIDGERFDNVGIRKKGLIGSLSVDKPGLKIKFDKFEPGRTWDGIERLTLNNAIADPSLVRQCLGYDIFRDAGIASSRCNFAHVSANGDDLGIYVNVEPVKKTFLKHAYDRDDDGDLYEGTLSDFRAGWTETFAPKTGDTDAERTRIHEVSDALVIADDAEMLAALETILDVDGFLDFWAVEGLVEHVDGYAGNTNNFFVYRPEDTDRLEFLPWGIDWIFRPSGAQVFANTALTRRLWAMPETRARYLARVEALLDEVWREDALVAEVDRMADMVEPFALWDDRRAADQQDLRDFIERRRDEVTWLLSQPLPSFEGQPLPGTVCVEHVGNLRVDFDTTWQTLEVDDPLGEGFGRIEGTLSGQPFDLEGGAVAGFDGGSSVFAALAFASPTVVTQSVLFIPSWQPLAVGTLPLDGFAHPALLVDIDLEQPEQPIVTAQLFDGSLTLTAWGTDPGDPVVGSFSGELYSGGFLE